MISERWLVLGATGQLGSTFVRSHNEVIGLGRTLLDLAAWDGATARGLLNSYRPTALINCAAYTNVERAESEETLARQVNGHAVGHLAEVAADAGIPFVTFSTDYVFNGLKAVPYVESDATSPLNAYGRSKVLGEQEALERNHRSLVIRTSWLTSGTHRNFITKILARVKRGERVSVVADQTGSPTFVGDLTSAAVALMRAGVGGVIHASNAGQATWYEFASHAVRVAGLDRHLVEATTTTSSEDAVVRPRFSVLESERWADLGIDPLPAWQDSLIEVVAELCG